MNIHPSNPQHPLHDLYREAIESGVAEGYDRADVEVMSTLLFAFRDLTEMDGWCDGTQAVLDELMVLTASGLATILEHLEGHRGKAEEPERYVLPDNVTSFGGNPSFN